MSNLKFQPTHRVLVSAIVGTHGYDMVDIDVNNGTFKKNHVNASDTKIRVKQGINAEKLCYNGGGDYNLPLKNTTAIKVIADFNKVRATLDFKPLEFWRFDEDEEN